MLLEGTLLEKLRKIEALHAGTSVEGERIHLDESEWRHRLALPGDAAAPTKEPLRVEPLALCERAHGEPGGLVRLDRGARLLDGPASTCLVRDRLPGLRHRAIPLVARVHRAAGAVYTPLLEGLRSCATRVRREGLSAAEGAFGAAGCPLDAAGRAFGIAEIDIGANWIASTLAWARQTMSRAPWRHLPTELIVTT